MSSPQSLIVVSGMSGSGKSVALHTLEDLGYYCTDNLPLGLTESFVAHLANREQRFARVALGLDVRSQPEDLARLEQTLTTLREHVSHCQLLFLDASDETLIKRYGESRRPHPLAGEGGSLAQAINEERHLLAPLARQADQVIDTSAMNIHQLRRQICETIGIAEKAMTILLESFAFKRGVPPDADFAFDVRCLPNPHWQPELRPLTGREGPVQDYLAGQPLVPKMVDDIAQWLVSWLPEFEQDQRRFLTIAIGCTGGKHRSVYVAEQIAERLRQDREQVFTYHRELS